MNTSVVETTGFEPANQGGLLQSSLTPLPKCGWLTNASVPVGVTGFEPAQPKHLIYSQAQLSNVGAPRWVWSAVR